MDNILLVPSNSLQHTRLILWALVIIGLCLIVILFIVFTSKPKKGAVGQLGELTHLEGAHASLDQQYNQDSGSAQEFHTVPVPLPVNDLRLTDEEMQNAILITMDKNIIDKLRNKLITLATPSISTNFRLYGTLTPEGKIRMFDHAGSCVAEFSLNNNFLDCNISGTKSRVRFPSKTKSFHFLLENYKFFLNGIELGEIHGQQYVQFIRVDDKEIREIQLMEIDPNMTMFEIGQRSIF